MVCKYMHTMVLFMSSTSITKKGNGNLDMETKNVTLEVAHKEEEDFLMEAFDKLLTKGKLTRDVTIGDLTLTLSPLSTSEFLEAETVYIAAMPNIPSDVVSRVRSVSSLVHAVCAVNGRPVPTERDADKKFRDKLYEQFMKLPPAVVDTVAIKYREIVEEQNSLYSNLGTNVVNF